MAVESGVADKVPELVERADAAAEGVRVKEVVGSAVAVKEPEPAEESVRVSVAELVKVSRPDTE